VVEGKQAAYFTPEGLATFYSSVYTVQADSDRMGVRLDGSAVESIKGSDIVSDGIALGAVQIPGSGKPIVLLNDRQTTGGYAKIGAVITGDLWRLAQAPGASAIRFERIDFLEAEKLYIKTEKEIARLKKQFTVRINDYGK
jgi:allophanate hydrolase subunit 2